METWNGTDLTNEIQIQIQRRAALLIRAAKLNPLPTREAAHPSKATLSQSARLPLCKMAATCHDLETNASNSK